MTQQSRREEYIHIAEAVAAMTAKAVEDSFRRAGDAGHKLTFRDRVLSGLALKIDSSFRAMIDDARVVRSEAMHHLKTMAEAFIYFHVVLAESSEIAARGLLAEAAHKKLIYFEKNPSFASEAEITEWQQFRDVLRSDGARRIGEASLEQLAVNHSDALGTWYAHTYRLACEPAHIGDLLEFMPPTEPTRTPLSRGERARALRCYVALDHGLAIMFAMARTINEANALGMAIPCESLHERWNNVRTVSSEGISL
jgi:hypothetical protein